MRGKGPEGTIAGVQELDEARKDVFRNVFEDHVGVPNRTKSCNIFLVRDNVVPWHSPKSAHLCPESQQAMSETEVCESDSAARN